MKRWIALLLAAALLFALPACSVKTETQAPTTEDPDAYPRVTVTAVETQEALTDGAGNTVINVESRIPKLTAGLEEGKLNMFNYLFESLRTEMRDRAVQNIDNAAADIKRGSGSPWLYKMDFSQSYAAGGFLCVVLMEQFSSTGNPEVTPVYHTKLLDLISGEVCPVTLFAYESIDPAEVRGVIEKLLLKDLRKNFLVNGARVPEETLAAAAASFDEFTYWFMADGDLIIPINRGIVGETGDYLCRIPAAEVEGSFYTPLAYREAQKALT